MVGVLVAILLITMVFEMAEHRLHHFLHHQGKYVLLEMMETLFKVLAILGFVSLFLFSITRWGGLMSINDYFLGVDELERVAKAELKAEGESPNLSPTHLFEIFEDMHFLIFGVMLLFVASVAVQVTFALRKQQTWESYEAKSEDEMRTELASGQKDRHQLEFSYFRMRFLHPTSPFVTTTSYPESFSFASYLSECLEENLESIVDIPIASWVASLFLLALSIPGFFLTSKEIAVFLGAASTFLVLAGFITSRRVRSWKEEIRPKLSAVELCLNEDSLQTIRTDYEKSRLIHMNRLGARIFPSEPALVSRQNHIPIFGSRGVAYTKRLLQFLVFVNVVAVNLLFRTLRGPLPWSIKGWLIIPMVLQLWAVLFLWLDIIVDITYFNSCDLNVKSHVVAQMDARIASNQQKRVQNIVDHVKSKAYETLLQDKPQMLDEVLPASKSILEDAVLKTTCDDLFDSLSSPDSSTEREAKPGTVSLEKIHIMQTSLHLDQHDKADAYYSKLKSRVSGLNYPEFLALCSILLGHWIPGGPALFAALDADRDGVVTEDDLLQVLGGMVPRPTMAEVRKLLFDITEDPANLSADYRQVETYFTIVSVEASRHQMHSEVIDSGRAKGAGSH
ncbi:MAG: hypothetical protein KVP17_002167 [Porospora cf. gigantea B]|uniref:uncharacterized protein n=1 Tax=Porospora cf. gigantea B TaxID=2853592 RepID=UPI003571B8FA|nr:MAG: hypothetical protein KVP17_002167 [Porospora cf. gigantea B]